MMNYMYTNTSVPNITSHVKNSFIFFKLAFYIQFLFYINCLSLIFHLLCTRWCRFTFLTHFCIKSQWWWRWTTRAVCLYHQHNQSIHVTDGVAVTSLSTSL